MSVPNSAIALLKDQEPGAFIIRDSHSFRGAYGLAMKVSSPPPTIMQQNKKGTIISQDGPETLTSQSRGICAKHKANSYGIWPFTRVTFVKSASWACEGGIRDQDAGCGGFLEGWERSERLFPSCGVLAILSLGRFLPCCPWSLGKLGSSVGSRVGDALRPK